MNKLSYDIIVNIFPKIKDIVDEEQWNRFNVMRSDWIPFEQVAKELGISILQAMALETPRKCIIKHNGDEEKLDKCIKGEIDP